MFNYIEFVYNPQRKHVRNDMLSPIGFEQQQKLKLQGVEQTRGHSDRRTWLAAEEVESASDAEGRMGLGPVAKQV